MTQFSLRPYQQAAVNAVLHEWDEGKKRTLAVMATGVGKTVVFAKVAENRVRLGDRVLVMAHRGELLDQASDKIYQSTGLRSSVEKAEQSCLGDWNRIVVGSVQTLCRDKRLNQFRPDYFGTIIVDEAHHAVSDSYQHVLSHFPDANVLGVTATPDRSDMRNMGTYFESLAFEYGMAKAIKDGYLCPIKAQTIPLSIDLSSVRMQSGDYKGIPSHFVRFVVFVFPANGHSQAVNLPPAFFDKEKVMHDCRCAFRRFYRKMYLCLPARRELVATIIFNALQIGDFKVVFARL